MRWGMTREEAIVRLENLIDSEKKPRNQLALQMAIDDMQEQEEREHPRPLTLAELREMDGEPVWCIDGCGHERWCLVSLKGNSTNAVDSENGLWWGGFYCMDGDGNYGLCNVGWIAFRHKPKED